MAYVPWMDYIEGAVTHYYLLLAWARPTPRPGRVRESSRDRRRWGYMGATSDAGACVEVDDMGRPRSPFVGPFAVADEGSADVVGSEPVRRQFHDQRKLQF